MVPIAADNRKHAWQLGIGLYYLVRLGLNAVYFCMIRLAVAWKQTVKDCSHSCTFKSLPAIFLISELQEVIYKVKNKISLPILNLQAV